MGSSKGRILVVDDDETMRPLLVDTLDAIGYESVPAVDGIEALRILSREGQFSFDLMISDVKMPNMDGLTLLKRIRRFYPELPVVFITGVISEETVAAASPDGFLAKPFRIAQLEELIESTLAARHSNWRPTPRPKVLINIDQDDIRHSIAEALSFTRYMPFEVIDRSEALEELERGSFDAMITDVETPDLGDEGPLWELRRRYPSLPLVLTSSSYSRDDVRKLDGRLGSATFVRNPISAGELIRALDRTTGEGPSS